MPKYVYYCHACRDEFEIKHSLQEKRENCEICKATKSLERKPAQIFLRKKDPIFSGEFEPGSVVKQSIEEAREELKIDQDNLSNREYKK